MTEGDIIKRLDDLLDGLKESIISLLGKENDERFKAGIEEGISQAKEALNNLETPVSKGTPADIKIKEQERFYVVTPKKKKPVQKRGYRKLKKILLNLEPGEYEPKDFIAMGFFDKTVHRNLNNALKDPEFRIKRIRPGYYIKEAESIETKNKSVQEKKKLTPNNIKRVCNLRREIFKDFGFNKLAEEVKQEFTEIHNEIKEDGVK